MEPNVPFPFFCPWAEPSTSLPLVLAFIRHPRLACALLILNSSAVHSSISHHVPVSRGFFGQSRVPSGEFSSFFRFSMLLSSPNPDCLLLSVLYTYTIRICTHTHPLVGHHSITRRIRLNVLNCFREKGGHLDTPYLLQDSSTQSTLSFAPHRTTTTLLCTCDMRP